MEKTLSLPSQIADSSYTLEISYDDMVAQRIQAYLNKRTWLNTASWLPPIFAAITLVIDTILGAFFGQKT